MLTVEVLGEALGVAQALGYRVRQEWLNGNPGGACVLRGRKLLFLDLALSPREQLEQVVQCLRGEPSLDRQLLSPSLRALVPESDVRQ